MSTIYIQMNRSSLFAQFQVGKLLGRPGLSLLNTHRFWDVSQQEETDDEGLNETLPKLQSWQCPLCFHQRRDTTESPRRPLCVALDGNYSLKRMSKGASESVGQQHYSAYRLPRSYVERFADQTISAQRQLNKYGLGGCADHWTAAEDGPIRGNMLDETGWFALTCCHGIVLAYADMVDGGEKAKYPLALVKWLADQYPDPIIFGYDIGCSFSKTFASAPMMESLVNENRISFRKQRVFSHMERQTKEVVCLEVGVFHGYAHNWGCQLEFNPRLTAVAGLHDFEACERLFAFTNKMAGVSRHHTAFHRHQMMEVMVMGEIQRRQRSLGKSLRTGQATLMVQLTSGVLGKFIEDNRIQAIRKKTASLKAIEELQVEHPDRSLAYYDAMIIREKRSRARAKCLLSLRREFWADARRLSIALLEASARVAAASASSDGGSPSPLILRQFTTAKANLLSFKRGDFPGFPDPDTEAGLQAIRDFVQRTSRQVSLSPGWIAYDKAVDELELACIARCQELDKVALPSTNYKLRTRIMNQTRNRDSSLLRAYSKYEAAWNNLPEPNRPTKLDRDVWRQNENDMSEAFIAIRDQQCFGSEDWAASSVREGVRLAREYRCAENELRRYEQERQDLKSWLTEEVDLYKRCINETPLFPHLRLDNPTIRTIWENGGQDEFVVSTISALAICRAQERLCKLSMIIQQIRSDGPQDIRGDAPFDPTTILPSRRISWSDRIRSSSATYTI